MKKLILIVTTGLLLAGSALAQSPFTNQLGFMLRFGIFRPTNSDAADLGDQWFTAGMEISLFKMKVPGSTTAGEVTMSADAFSKAGATAVPVLLNYAAYSGSMRYSLGAGAAFLNRELFDNSARFAMQFSIGYVYKQGPFPIVLEGRYYSIFDEDRFFDGFGITIGLKL